MIAINGHILQPTIFPDKTSQVWKLPDHLKQKTHFEIHWKFENEGEIIQLAQLKKLLDHLGGSKTSANLYLPYLPYGRQDKQISNNATFALSVFADLLNSLNFNQVHITDPHSPMALTWIHRSTAQYMTGELTSLLNQNFLLCYPDLGASVKYSNVEGIKGHEYIFAKKVRDQETGIITGMELMGDCNGRSVLIVDDICDGGATFVRLAELLKVNRAAYIVLYISHMIDKSVKNKLLKAGIAQVYTKEGLV